MLRVLISYASASNALWLRHGRNPWLETQELRLVNPVRMTRYLRGMLRAPDSPVSRTDVSDLTSNIRLALVSRTRASFQCGVSMRCGCKKSGSQSRSSASRWAWQGGRIRLGKSGRISICRDFTAYGRMVSQRHKYQILLSFGNHSIPVDDDTNIHGRFRGRREYLLACCVGYCEYYDHRIPSFSYSKQGLLRANIEALERSSRTS